MFYVVTLNGKEVMETTICQKAMDEFARHCSMFGSLVTITYNDQTNVECARCNASISNGERLCESCSRHQVSKMLRESHS